MTPKKKRVKPYITITLSKENIEYLRKVAPKRGVAKYIDNLLTEHFKRKAKRGVLNV